MSKKLKWEPSVWSKQLQNIEIMRKDRNAPVDIVGCESISNIEPLLSEKVKITVLKILLKSK
jgi:hypothetical protein